MPAAGELSVPAIRSRWWPLRTGARGVRLGTSGVRSPVPEEKAGTHGGAMYHPTVPAQGLAGARCGA